MLSPSPVWLNGVETVESVHIGTPQYSSAPAKVTRPLATMTAKSWSYSSTPDVKYETNHFAARRVADPNLQAEFGKGEAGHTDAVAITLAPEPGDRPLATRYGVLQAKQPIPIPGKPSALGLWVKGNAGWGRVVYQVRDAKGEIWTSAGTRNDWNSDDTHGWSYVSFEGWRYVRFPLPGNLPYDAARELETTWWGSRGGDGIADLPLIVEKIFVEARNEVPYLGEMKTLTNRSYKLSQLIAEYESEFDATPDAIAQSRIRKPRPAWSGPRGNLIAKLAQEGQAEAPVIGGFTEPGHFNDGRRMVIRFDQDKANKYNLYISRYPDGRGAELLSANVTDGQLVTGLLPEIEMHLFLTAIGADQKESKPSPAYRLVTKDNFREK